MFKSSDGIYKDQSVYSSNQIYKDDPLIEDPEQDSETTKIYKREYARHLDQPILTEKCDFYRENKSYFVKRFPHIPHDSLRDLSSGFSGEQNLISWIQGWVTDRLIQTPEITNRQWNLVIDAIKTSLELQLEVIASKLTSNWVYGLDKLLSELTKNHDARHALSTKIGIIQFNQRLSVEANKGKPTIDLTDEFEILLCDDLVYFPSFPGKGITIPYNLFLSVLDMMEAKFSFLVYSILADNAPLFSSVPYLHYSQELYNLLEKWRNLLGNKYCYIAKALEPLAVASVIRHDHLDNTMPQLLKNLFSEADKLGDKITEAYMEIHLFFYLICQKYHDLGVRIVLEQYGQEKLHGYPILNPIVGLNKMREEGTKLGTCDLSRGNWLRGSLAKYYIRGYFLKEGQLPPIREDWTLHPFISEMYKNKVLPSARSMNSISNVEWAQIHFEPHQTFDYYHDILDLVDDKAAAPSLQNKNQIYFPDAQHRYKLVRPMCRDTTKLLLFILENDDINIEEYFDEINQGGQIPVDWSLIVLKMKEREEKEGGRPFSVMHPKLRMIASCLERNISHSILKYFADQTITDSGSTLKGRVDDWLRLKDEPDHVWTYFNMDFSNWNYHFREVITGPSARLLDSIFGTENFKWSPKLFIGAKLVYGSPFIPDEAGVDGTTWDNHLGGNQGICQKFWTILTQLIIREVLDEMGYKYHLMGSGDNQVLAISLPNNQDHEKICNSIIKRLQSQFEKFNLVLKDSETWYSTKLLAYQRKYYYKRVALESGIKHSVRSFFGISDIDSGLSSQVSTAMQSGMVMVEATSSGLVGPIFAYLEALIAFINHCRIDRFIGLSSERLVELTLMTSDIGGLPFLQITSFMYAGHRDTLTECLAFFAQLWKVRPDLRGSVCRIFSASRSTNVSLNRLRLVLNPNSACYNTPITPDIIITGKVEQELRKPGLVKNRQLKDLLMRSAAVDKLAVVENIYSLRPINLSLYKSLFESTNTGETLALMNRFNSVSSLVQFTKMNNLRNKNELFSTIMNNCDGTILAYLSKRLRSPGGGKNTFWQVVIQDEEDEYIEFCHQHQFKLYCSFALRLYLVSSLIGENPELVDGPFTPAPLEQLSLGRLSHDTDLSHSIILEPSSDIPHTVTGLTLQRGPFRPYIGSKTQDTARSLKLTTLEHSTAGKRVKLLTKIIAWMHGIKSHEDVHKALELRMEELAPGLGVQLIRLRTGITFGNFIHRYHGGGEVSGAFDYSRSHVATHYRISTNRATMFQRNDDDFYLFFQQLFQYIISLARVTMPMRNPLNFVINIDCCTYRLEVRPFFVKDNEEFTLIDGTEGVILDDHHLGALKKEIDWKISLQDMKKGVILTGKNMLAGVVAFQLIKPIYKFNHGGFGDLRSGELDGGPQGDFNVTNLRKVGMIQLMKCILIQLAYHQILGPGRTPESTRRLLATHLSRRGSTIRVEPFRGLFEAILTSGNLEQWVQLARVSVPRSELRSGIGLLSVFLNGLLNVLADHHDKDPKYTLIVEIKSPQTHYKNLLKFLASWGNKNTRLELHHHKTGDFSLLTHWQSAHPRVNLVVTADIELVYEEARSKIRDEMETSTGLETITKDVKTKRGFVSHDFDPFFQVTWMSTDRIECQPVEELQTIRDITWLKNRWPSHYSDKLPQFGHLYILARPGTTGSSGHFKLVEIISRLGVVIHADQLVVCLAEGSGSMLACLLHIQPNCKGVYNSLNRPEDFPHSLSTRSLPTDCICECAIEKRIINWDQIGLDSGDLYHIRTWNKIESILASCDYQEGILTFDMEGIGVDKEVIYSHLVAHLNKHKYNSTIIKIFFEELNGSAWDLITCLHNIFDVVSAIKPASSNPSSTELYLVGQFPSRMRRQLHRVSLHPLLSNVTKQFSTLPLVCIVERILGAGDVNNSSNVCQLRPMTISPMVSGAPHTLKEWLQREVASMFHLILSSCISSRNSWKLTHSMRLSSTKGADAISTETRSIWLALCYCLSIRCPPHEHSSAKLTHYELAKKLVECFASCGNSLEYLKTKLDTRQFFTALGEFLFTVKTSVLNEHLPSITALDKLIVTHKMLDHQDTAMNHPLFDSFKYYAHMLDSVELEKAAERWPVPALLNIYTGAILPLSQEYPFPLNITYWNLVDKLWIEEFDFPLLCEASSTTKLHFQYIDNWESFDIKNWSNSALILSSKKELPDDLPTKRKPRILSKGPGETLATPVYVYYFPPPYWVWLKKKPEKAPEKIKIADSDWELYPQLSEYVETIQLIYDLDVEDDTEEY